jgi:DNA-binding response OmpR family regulator
MAHRILVVADACGLSASVQETIAGPAFVPIPIVDISDVVWAVRVHRPSLLLFEIEALNSALKELLYKLKDLNGSRSIRKIIIATSGDLEDKVTALDLGADAFLTKPISSRELGLQIGATIRCSAAGDDAPSDVRSMGSMELVQDTKEVVVDNRRTSLTRTEFDLLAYFMDRPGHVMNRAELIKSLWLSDDQDHRVVDVYIFRLREKIEANPSQPQRLVTVRGAGYCLVKPVTT